jgi:hypothetical protein
MAFRLGDSIDYLELLQMGGSRNETIYSESRNSSVRENFFRRGDGFCERRSCFGEPDVVAVFSRVGMGGV